MKLDLQLHIPYRDIPAAAETAIHRGIDVISLTDYGSTQKFEDLARNKNTSGHTILNPRNWEISNVSPLLIKLESERGRVYVIKGQETHTKEGDLLVYGISESIPGGLCLDETLKRAFIQRGIAVFAHPFANMFGGCGKEIVAKACAYYKSKGNPIAVEKNAQLPESAIIPSRILPRWNEDVKFFADNHSPRIACLASSDCHPYRKHYEHIGKWYNFSIDGLNEGNIIEGLTEVAINRPGLIKIHGTSCSLLEPILWNLASIKQNGWPKFKGILKGFSEGLKK